MNPHIRTIPCRLALAAASSAVPDGAAGQIRLRPVTGTGELEILRRLIEFEGLAKVAFDHTGITLTGSRAAEAAIDLIANRLVHDPAAQESRR